MSASLAHHHHHLREPLDPSPPAKRGRHFSDQHQNDPTAPLFPRPQTHPMTSASNSTTTPTSSSSSSASPSTSSSKIQFFVRTDSKTLVLHAAPDDTVESVLARLSFSSGACGGRDLRLIYQGKQLSSDATLSSCNVRSDSLLHLSARLRSTPHPHAWQLASHIAATASDASSYNPSFTPDSHSSRAATAAQNLHSLIKEFLTAALSTPKTDHPAEDGMNRSADRDRFSEYLEIFIQSGAPVALVRLYITGHSLFLRSHAEKAVKIFLTSDLAYLPRESHLKCATVLMEFCRLLVATAGKKDALYVSCRGGLATVLGSPDWRTSCGRMTAGSVLALVMPFAKEMVEVVVDGLGRMSVSSRDLSEFSCFLLVVRREVQDQMRHGRLMSPDVYERDGKRSDNNWAKSLYGMYDELVRKVNLCLNMMEMDLSLSSENKGLADSESTWEGRSFVLSVLTELNLMAEMVDIYENAADKLRFVLQVNQQPLNALARWARRSQNLTWLLKHKDLLGFEARRNLVLMMLPEGKDDYGELHEMLIDRSQLLSESFEYITQASAQELRGGLFMEFKNEEATGPGVLREWFCLVSHALFSPQHVLFLPCPNDKRRFYLNPTSYVDPLHLKYFVFSGRMIALALMHKVQLGIVFDGILFSQLAGKSISVEDIKEADPFLYASCKQIQEMDAELVDSDMLALTFVREVEELGSRKVIELCDGGKDIAVNSKNRGHYIDLLIQDRFVKSISVQLTHFAQGFSDILVNSSLQKTFFESLDLEDFDRMLGGNDSMINVADWKSHTEYNGYKEKDRQIGWFWKAVERMSIEQQRRLLFFWTSVKYLPADGFSGLGSKLYIYRTSDSHDHLPSSHTCFYRICLPLYSSFAMMQSRLQMITQEHVSCSFGTW